VQRTITFVEKNRTIDFHKGAEHRDIFKPVTIPVLRNSYLYWLPC